MAKQVRPGAVLEVEAPGGVIYLQYVGRHPHYGDAVVVAPKIVERRVADEGVFGDGYFIFYPARRAVGIGLAKRPPTGHGTMASEEFAELKRILSSTADERAREALDALLGVDGPRHVVTGAIPTNEVIEIYSRREMLSRRPLGVRGNFTEVLSALRSSGAASVCLYGFDESVRHFVVFVALPERRLISVLILQR